MSDTYVPMISSGTAGPLGVLHLPRLWQKVSLESQGKLAAGYPGIGRGYDAMTCAALGLEENAVQDYITQYKPTYPQFEAWSIVVKPNESSVAVLGVEIGPVVREDVSMEVDFHRCSRGPAARDRTKPAGTAASTPGCSLSIRTA